MLNQKTELQRALEKQKEHLAKKQIEDNSRIPELEKVIANRAKRLQSPNEDKVNNNYYIEISHRMSKRNKKEKSSSLFQN